MRRVDPIIQVAFALFLIAAVVYVYLAGEPARTVTESERWQQIEQEWREQVARVEQWRIDLQQRTDQQRLRDHGEVPWTDPRRQHQWDQLWQQLPPP